MMRMQADQATDPQKAYAGTGIIGWLVFGLVLATAVVIFVAQNVDRVDVQWLWFDFRVSLAVIALGGVLLGVIAAVVLGLVWRRHRRAALRRDDELAVLRSAQDPVPVSGVDEPESE